MSTYKLIATDLDGTLIGTDMNLSEQNRQAIKELTDAGVLVVPATGRTIAEMGDVYHLPEFRYVIYSNGASVIDKQTGELMFFGFFEENTRFIKDVLKEYDMFIVLHKDGKAYCDRAKVECSEKYNLNNAVLGIIKKSITFADNFEEVFNGNVEMISVFFKNNDDLLSCRQKLSLNPDIATAEGWEYNLEIFFKNAGKANALKTLSEKLGIDINDVITIGDSDNDRIMTTISGLGLVTANACESLKEVADKVICSNDEHVLEYVKNHYFI